MIRRLARLLTGNRDNQELSVTQSPIVKRLSPTGEQLPPPTGRPKRDPRFNRVVRQLRDYRVHGTLPPRG